jgi:hypothetical protein
MNKAKTKISDKKNTSPQKSEANPNSSEKRDDLHEISPFVRSISTGKEWPADIDFKKEHSEYLMDKHK